jgi:hypothetical protein
MLTRSSEILEAAFDRFAGWRLTETEKTTLEMLGGPRIARFDLLDPIVSAARGNDPKPDAKSGVTVFLFWIAHQFTFRGWEDIKNVPNYGLSGSSTSWTGVC